MEFPVVPNNPQTRALSLCFAIPSLIILAVTLILFATTVVDSETSLYLALFLTLAPAAAIWKVQQYGRGSARLDSSELVVRTRGWTHSYNWSDVADVRLTSFAEMGAAARLWARILLWPEREPFVELRLRRALRVGLWSERYGTRLKGIPLIGGERVTLFVHEPESFVRSAKSYLDEQGE